MLDVRRLLLLREVHARGTVAAAARALDYTPSAVSQQLARLQIEAGVALTERIGRRLRLTSAGLELVAHADALAAQLERAEADLRRATTEVRGVLRLAGLQTPMLSVVPGALRLIGERHPDLRVEATEAEPEDALPSLRLGELDVVVAEEYDDAPRARLPAIARRALGRDEILLVLPRDHPQAAGGGPVALADLAGEAWVSPQVETAFTAMHARACRLAGFEPDVRHRSNDVGIILALVAAGQAVALLPGLARPQRDPRVAVRTIADVRQARTIYAFHRESGATHPAIAATVRALGDAAAGLEAFG